MGSDNKRSTPSQSVAGNQYTAQNTELTNRVLLTLPNIKICEPAINEDGTEKKTEKGELVYKIGSEVAGKAKYVGAIKVPTTELFVCSSAIKLEPTEVPQVFEFIYGAFNGKAWFKIQKKVG